MQIFSFLKCLKVEKYTFLGGWVGGWVIGIGNKAQLSPVIAGTGAWPELGKICPYYFFSLVLSRHFYKKTTQSLKCIPNWMKIN